MTNPEICGRIHRWSEAQAGLAPPESSRAIYGLCRMNSLYPLLMLPAFDPRPWGTLDLSPIYPNHKFEEKIGEAWLSGDDCKVANGPLKGRTLAQLSEEYQRELV